MGHLVNTLFLHQAHRILQPGGTFTLTTDDEKLVTTVCQRLVTDPSLHARWQPAFGAPHYKAHENGLRGHRSAFDELWAARGFARRFQCRFQCRLVSRSHVARGGALWQQIVQFGPPRRRWDLSWHCVATR